MQPSHRRIVICGDFNYQSCPLNNVSNFPLKGIKTFKRIISGRIAESRTDHIMLYPPTHEVESVTIQN